MAPFSTLSRDDRGASEVIGYVLLIGLVISATGITVVMGSQAISGLQAENDATAAQAILEDVDAELTTLAASNDAPTTDFQFDSSAGEKLSVSRGGHLNVTIVDPTGRHCTSVATLGTIRFEQGDRVVAYEGGGIWSGSTEGGSAMIAPPDVSFRDGSLDVSLVNVSGQIDGTMTEADVDRLATRRNNTRHRSNLQQCDQVEEVHVSVNSTFHRAWGGYLEEQTGVEPVETGSESVRVELSAGDLPIRADMANNSAVNTSNPGYMTENGGSGFNIGPDTITVDKNANNAYLVSAQSLTQRPPRISQVRELSAENISNRQRPPVDVVFVMDESGSMGGDKIDEAREAAKNAVGTMNMSVIGDRAGIVGYEEYPDQRRINAGTREVYFHNDADSVDDAIEDLTAGGSTDIAAGLNQSLAALSYREQQREAHVILMTDGQNSPGGSKCGSYSSNFDYDHWYDCTEYFNERTMNAAQIADERGVTVHAFSFGDGATTSLMRKVADETGGNFNESADGDELADAFEATVGGFTNRRDYATRTPLTTNFTGGGEVHPPQIVGDTDPLASTTSAGGKTFLNVNDPTAPTLFSHSFRADDGDPVVINATKFDCAEDAWVDTGDTVETDSRTLPVARCGKIVTTNDSLDTSRIDFYTDGDDMTPLMTNDDINDTLQRYNDTSAAHRFDLDSNAVVINLNFERQGEFENNLILRYEIGLAESEVNGADVVNLQETVVNLG